MKDRKLLVVCGPSGIGKTTRCKQLVEENGKNAFYIEWDQVIKDAYAEANADYWDINNKEGRPIAIGEKAVSKYYHPPYEEAINGNVPLVIRDHPLNDVKKADELIKLAEKGHRDLEVEMLFSRNAIEPIQRMLERSYSEKDIAERFIDAGYPEQYIKSNLERRPDFPKVLEFFLEKGIPLKLYENNYAEDRQLSLIAEIKSGALIIRDNQAYQYFCLQEKLNPEASITVAPVLDSESQKYSYPIQVEKKDLFPDTTFKEKELLKRLPSLSQTLGF